MRLTLLAAVFASHAWAVESRAAQLFNKGRALLAAEKLGPACAAFDASLELERALGTLLNAASCHEQLDELPAAQQLFTEAEQLALSRQDGRVTLARERLKGLTPRLAMVTVELPAGAVNVEVVVGTLKKTPNPRAGCEMPLFLGSDVEMPCRERPLRLTLPALPGPCIVRVEWDTHHWSTVLNLSAGQASTVSPPAEAKAAPVMGGATRPPPEPPLTINKSRDLDPNGLGLLIGGSVVTASGVALLAVTLTQLALLQPSRLTAESSGLTVVASQLTRQQFETMRTLNVVGWASLAVGAAAVASGVLVLEFRRKTPVSATLLPMPGGVSASLAGAF